MLDIQQRFESLMHSRFEKRLHQAWNEARRQGVLLAAVNLVFYEGEEGFEMFLVPGWVESANPELAKSLREEMSEFAKWRAAKKEKGQAEV